MIISSCQIFLKADIKNDFILRPAETLCPPESSFIKAIDLFSLYNVYIYTYI